MSEVELHIGKLTLYHDAMASSKTMDDAIKEILGETVHSEDYNSWLERFYEVEYNKPNREYIVDEARSRIYKTENKEVFLPVNKSYNMSSNADGTIDYVACFYNGVTHLDAELQNGLKEINDQEIKTSFEKGELYSI